MSTDGRYLTAYLTGGGKDGRPRTLTTWSGDVLGTWREVSSWFQWPPRGGDRYRMAAIRARLADGRTYYGRVSMDWSELFRGRLCGGAR